MGSIPTPAKDERRGDEMQEAIDVLKTRRRELVGLMERMIVRRNETIAETQKKTDTLNGKIEKSMKTIDEYNKAISILEPKEEELKEVPAENRWDEVCKE